MATRKPGTVAAINRQIDAINAKGRRGNPTASKSAKIKADVRRFAKEHGIAISPNAGESPLMGKGDWFKVFDSWLQAHDYFTGWKWKHADHGLPFPWDERKGNPARTATLVARKPAAKNPARKRTRAQWASEIARIQSLMKSGDNRAAYDHARWLYDETLDEYSRASGEAAKKVRALMDELNERRYSKNPTRTATLVARKPAAKNPGARNLSAPRKKPRENWPRFVVEEKEGVGPWMPRASFRIIEDAEKLARDIHRAQPTIAVRVIDTKS